MKFALNFIWMVLVGFILVGVSSSPTSDESGELLWCFSIKKQALSDPNNEFTDEMIREDANLFEFVKYQSDYRLNNIFTWTSKSKTGPLRVWMAPVATSTPVATVAPVF
jgi:hypothetical protein